jgi:Flp pilus assembly pilin Flp
MQLIQFIREKLLAFNSEESGQDIFEYVLIIGGVTLAIIVAAAITVPELFSSVADGVCGAIDSANFGNVDLVCNVT